MGGITMICSVRTLGINGIHGNSVVAECYISNGLPGFDIVGLPDAAVKEARERVRAAAKNSGLTFPVSRITVNLAPANLKKAGTHYDLPILMSIMLTEVIKTVRLSYPLDSLILHTEREVGHHRKIR
jgi:magnesium chelatase family protein